MAKRPKRKFNLFDEEFGEASSPIESDVVKKSEDPVARRIRLRQAIVDLPLESKIDYLKNEAFSEKDFSELCHTLAGIVEHSTSNNPTSVLPNSNEPALKTEDKPETKWRQTEDKSLTLADKTRDKAETNRGQKYESAIEIEDKVETQPRTKLETKRRQTEDKAETNPRFSGLLGLQRKLIIFLYHSCKAARSSTTDPLTIEHIAKSCETSASSVKKTLQRLEAKGFYRRAESKNGRGGWTRYELEKSVFQDLFRYETEDKLETNRGQTEDKLETQLETQPRTSLSSSSSDLLNKGLTTTSEPVDNFWQNVTWQILAPYGFTETHFRQLQDSKVDPARLQTSIEAFEFDLRVNKRTFQKGPVAVFMGIMRKGGEYAPPSNFESEEDKILRELVERKEQARSRKLELEAKALDFEFETWLEQLNQESRNEIVPETSVIRSGTKTQMVALKTHFQDKIWPELKSKIVRGEVEI